jgi:hypothetical protein
MHSGCVDRLNVLIAPAPFSSINVRVYNTVACNLDFSILVAFTVIQHRFIGIIFTPPLR